MFLRHGNNRSRVRVDISLSLPLTFLPLTIFFPPVRAGWSHAISIDLSSIIAMIVARSRNLIYAAELDPLLRMCMCVCAYAYVYVLNFICQTTKNWLRRAARQSGSVVAYVCGVEIQCDKAPIVSSLDNDNRSFSALAQRGLDPLAPIFLPDDKEHFLQVRIFQWESVNLAVVRKVDKITGSKIVGKNIFIDILFNILYYVIPYSTFYPA